MKKKRILGIAVCAALLIVAALVAQRTISMQSRFDGSRVRNPDAYLLTFSCINQDDAHSMHMEKGDLLRVDYEIQRGRVDVRVETEEGEMIYRGDRVDSGSFALPAVRAGEYRVSVHAEKAAGRLSFTVEREAAPSFS
ncbi:MAG: hypothetical protein Q4G06_05355 [Clostridia bacterium]|nr:hypothetical protein [Clostridia bacterium]